MSKNYLDERKERILNDVWDSIKQAIRTNITDGTNELASLLTLWG